MIWAFWHSVLSCSKQTWEDVVVKGRTRSAATFIYVVACIFSWAGTKGPKMDQDSIPHTTTSLSCWYKAVWSHAFMLFMAKFDMTTWMLKSRLIRWAQNVPIFCFLLLKTVASVSWSYSSSTQCAVTIQRCSAASISCNDWLYEMLSPSSQLEAVCPFFSMHFHPENSFSWDIFILCKP